MWGSTAVRVTAQQRHYEYETALLDELDHVSFNELPRNVRRWQDWARIARDIDAQAARVAKLHPPADARAAQRALLATLRQAHRAYAVAATALRHRSRAEAARRSRSRSSPSRNCAVRSAATAAPTTTTSAWIA